MMSTPTTCCEPRANEIYIDKQMDMHNAKITKTYTSELSAVIVSSPDYETSVDLWSDTIAMGHFQEL